MGLRKSAKWVVVLILVGLIWGIFLRDPIGIGEYNKDRLRNKDSARSEKVMKSMPADLKDYVENKLFEQYDDHLIFIEKGGVYYAMVDVSGTLLQIDAKTQSVKELFSLQKYSCNVKVKGDKISFLSGRIESRDRRNLGARLIHPSTVSVLTEVEKRVYDFQKGKLYD